MYIYAPLVYFCTVSRYSVLTMFFVDIIAALCNLNAMPKCQIPLLKCQAADPDGVDQSTLSGNRKSFRCFGPKDGVSWVPADEFDDFAHSFGVSFFCFSGRRAVLLRNPCNSGKSSGGFKMFANCNQLKR